MTLDKDTIAKLAARLEAAERNREPLTKITDEYPALDYEDAGKPGYDKMSEPMKNAALSAASFAVAGFSGERRVSKYSPTECGGSIAVSTIVRKRSSGWRCWPWSQSRPCRRSQAAKTTIAATASR